MNTSNFKQLGFVQQYGAFLIKMGRIVDGLLIVVSLYFITILTGTAWDALYLVHALLAVIIFQVITSFFELYRSWRIMRLSHELLKLLGYWSAAFFITLMLSLLNEPAEFIGQLFIGWFLLTYFFMTLSRVLSRVFLRKVRAIGHDHRRAAFIGYNEVSRGLSDTFTQQLWMGIDIIGYFDDRKIDNIRMVKEDYENISGNINQLVDIARERKVDVIYICLPMSAEKRIKKLIDSFSDTTVSICYCPSFFEFDLFSARWDDVFGQPVISVIESPFSGHERITKRIEDLILAILILPLIALPMLFIALAIKLTSSGPVFYRQTRYGMDAKAFKIWKFRSMYSAEKDDEFIQAKKGDARITRVGKFIRKTSLDELPQFFNVVSGEMSIVGPRPHPIKLNEAHRKLIHRYMIRHKVKPGITGLAQISGFRGETDSEYKMVKRIEYDLKYIRTWSLLLDLEIIIKTIPALISEKDAY